MVMTAQKGSVRDFARIIAGLMPDVGPSLALFTVVSIFYELIKFIPVYLLKLIVDDVISTPHPSYLMLLVLAVFCVLILQTIIEVIFVGFMARLASTQQKKVLERSFSKLAQLPMSWHEKQNTGSLISKLTKAASYVDQFVWFMGENIVPVSLQMILTGAVLIWVDWRIGAIYAVFTVMLLFLIDSQARKVQPLREVYHQEYEESTREFAQTLYNMQTVKDYVQEGREGQTHSAALQRYVAAVWKRIVFEFHRILNRGLITNTVRAGTMALAIKFVLDGSMTPGELVFVVTLTEKAYVNLHRLGRAYSFMGDSHEALSRALEVQQSTNSLPDAGTQEPKQGDIVFSKVDFAYGKETVLCGVDVSFTRGKVTAIVGPSGGGKTTMVKLIMRHYDPTGGLISYGGVDLRDVKIGKLRSKIAFVSQHTEIFDRTVAENISYGRPGASKEEIIKAAKQANAHEFISKFTNGYGTLVGEKGVRLSGGQRQRVSIARALLANPEVIIFDEATSSLDSESERAIQQAVFSIKGKTLIIIAHRFSTIEHSDKIIVLSDGKVVESGSHKDLIKKKSGMYKRMRSLQSLGELRK